MIRCWFTPNFYDFGFDVPLPFLRVLRGETLLSLFLTDLLNDLGDVDPHRADADAPTAAAAKRLTELVVVVLKLVHDAVAVALGLPISGVVPRGVVGELPETASVPVFPALAGFFGPLVDDVETVAGRADEGAGPAADATDGNGIPGYHGSSCWAAAPFCAR